MNFRYSLSSRPATKSSFTSQHSNGEPKQSVPSRTVSNLKRSNELLSVEEELRELLKNSHLNKRQKKAFSEMLETTFDLFQVPLQTGTQRESLIDSSSIELYGKMQSLVTALTSLIMNEEEATRLEISRIHDDVEIEDNDDDSTEFSDGEENTSFKASIDPVDSRSFPRASAISDLRPLSRSSSITDSAKRHSYLKNSPSLTSNNPSIHRYNNSPTLYNASMDVRPYERYQGLQPNNNFKPALQVVQTPIPRSFSTRSERPKSMYVGKHDMNPLPNFSTISSRSSSIHNLQNIIDQPKQFEQEFGSEPENTSRYLNRRDSIKDQSSWRSKRYSMRF